MRITPPKSMLCILLLTLLISTLSFTAVTQDGGEALPEAVDITQVDETSTADASAPIEESQTMLGRGLDALDRGVGYTVGKMATVIFYPIGLHVLRVGDIPVIAFPVPDPGGIPIIVLILFLGGVFFTFRYGFVNIRLFKHAFDAIRGKFDDPNEVGEISHFKALTSALAATVGLGNIAGVAVAITAGGPGAVFWMWLTAFFGMSLKFSSCALAQTYRRVQPDGHVLGGPMVYLRDAMLQRFPGGLWVIGTVFSYAYAVIIVFAAFAAGNMFQGNQTYFAFAFVSGLSDTTPYVAYIKLGTGIFLAILVGVVIIGGIKRIGEVTSKLVPTMCLFYVCVCAIIVFSNFEKVPALLMSIFHQAYSPEAVFGGFIGVLVQGMKRAAFSNEAGLGSASIAQAAAKTNEPIRAASVAMLGPVVDTMIVCTMTALAILITETHDTNMEGVEITAAAFSEVWVHLPWFLAVAVFIFAYSTMISWSYYGERAAEYLFGKRGIMPYRIVYVLMVIAGPILSLGSVIDLADLFFLSLAIPNILGMVLLSGKVGGMTKDYIRRLRAGEMAITK